MPQQILNNGETLGTIRGKINANFTEIYSVKLEAAQVLTRTNTSVFTPTSDYHPATKSYADSLISSWHSVYNPQSISADVFDRANHTGTQAPATIETDSTNRFVTDSDISNWNSKEPAIGTKNTAFNKNFGTGAGTVAYGDHTHTKNDLGLGNVDNTSDVNKPVSTAQQAALDLKINKNPNLIDFAIQVTPPSHNEGQLFYDQNSRTLALHSDISDVTLNIGQEQYMRVINKTGTTITNGSACRHDGVDASTGLPKIALAIADSFIHSRVMGIATHDIANNAEGFITTFGQINNINTSLLPIGVPLYLSDTVAGSYTGTPPDIVTQIGGALFASTNGAIMVSILNHIALPTLFGVLQDAPDTYTLTGDSTYETIDNYQISDDVGLAVSSSSGKITLPNAGWYRLNINVNFTISTPPPSGTHIINFRLYNFTQSASEVATTVSIPSTFTATDIASRSISVPFEVVANDEVGLQVNSADNSSNLDFDSISFDIESISIR